MTVTFHLPLMFAQVSNARTIDARGSTVGEVIADVATRYPMLAARLCDNGGNPNPFAVFYLNDQDIRGQRGFDTAVKDGDDITIVPAIAGG
jgi:molybdopterin converting factor small subunit